MPSEKLPFSYAHKAKNATLIKLSDTDALPFLRSGEIVGGQRIPRGSNYTFLIWIAAGTGKYLPAVYKPRNGERPLHDFPQGTLYKREYAAFVLSSALGWPNVPPTLVREGPHGIGKGYNNIPLREGMVVSNEPGYYRENEFGIRIENLIYVKRIKEVNGKKLLGFDNLTFVPIDKRLMDLSMLTKFEKDWINNYHKEVLKKISIYLQGSTLEWLKNASKPI